MKMEIKKERTVRTMLFLIGIFLILSLGMISAVDCENYIGSFYRGENITLRQTCDSCSYVILSSITSEDSLTPINQNMTKNGVDFSYIIVVNKVGDYFYSVAGDKDGVLTAETFCFDVKRYNKNSPFGLDVESPLFIAICIFLLAVALLSIFLFKKVVLGGSIIIVLGFILLFSWNNWLLPLIVIIGGVLALFLE